MDSLSDALNNISFKGSLYCQAEFSAPWGLKLEGCAGHAGFLMVLRGSCFMTVEGQEPIVMGGGDLAVAATNSSCLLQDDLGSPLISISEAAKSKTEQSRVLKLGGSGKATTLLMGCFELEAGSRNPLVKSLPPLIYLRAEELESEPWIESTIRFLAAETAQERPGGEIVVSRLTDLLFIQIIRAHMKRMKDCPKSTGWLKALSDPEISKALTLIHEKPEAPWTVAALADSVGLSRTSFAVKFANLAGIPPLEYVTSWRMQKAKTMLKRSTMSIQEIALAMGYSSEAAFAKAFKRETGESPGAYRKTIVPEALTH
ncbi:MAG: AraC family transcriptional regulator [Candidatus Obscuribacterales bacterium]|nr:AraC family transcriptional regulator [Candidatus Obscuribacterales bacterium]